MNISDLKIKKVLDLATGTGQFIPYLLEENNSIEEIIGVDVCEKSIAHAEKTFTDTRVSFLKADASNLPFKNNSFDAITINNSLHHFEKISDILKEAKRLLKADGYLIVNEMTCDEGQTRAQESHILIHHSFAEIDRFFHRFHDNTYSSEELLKYVVSNGFEILDKVINSEEIANPKDEKLIANYTATMTMTLDRIKDKVNDDILKNLEMAIKHLQEFGFSPAKSIMIMAKKEV